VKIKNNMVFLTGYSVPEWEKALGRPLEEDMKLGAFFNVVVSQLHQMRAMEKAGRKSQK